MVSSAIAVLPVWRSPMISSRWPRPIGISASMAFRPVAIGSCTDLRGMMPGAFTSTRDLWSALIGPLPSIRSPRAAAPPPGRALADRNLDDRARALDGLAFLDLAIGAEDHDADIVGFEIERHAFDAALELDHLAGLHVIEAIDAGDAVADRQHLADFGDFGLLAEILDLLFENRGDFRSADIHYRASFMACLIALSLVRSELSTMRLPSLTTSPPMMAGSTLISRSTSLPLTALSAARSASTCSSLSFSATVTSAVASPLCAATSSRKPLIMSRTANRRRFDVTSFKNFVARPPM